MKDLGRAIIAIEEQDDELVTTVGRSSFSIEIQEALLPEGFKLPNIKAYEEKTDPQDHLDYFNDLMELHMVSDLAKCRVFIVTLSNGVKKWFRLIPRSAKYFVPEAVPSDQVVSSTACSLRKCQIEQGREFKVLFESLHHRAVQSKMGTGYKSVFPSYQWSIARNSILGLVPAKGMQKYKQVLQKGQQILKIKEFQ